MLRRERVWPLIDGTYTPQLTQRVRARSPTPSSTLRAKDRRLAKHPFP